MRCGYAGWRNNCSSFRNSCCDLRSHRTNIRNSGNSFRAGAAMLNILPMNHNSCCDRWHKSSQILSARKHRSTNDSRCWYKWLPAHSGESMYGCRRRGKSTIRKNRNRGLYTHKSLNSEHNGTYSTHNTPDDLWMYASWKRRSPAKNTAYSLGRCRQCRWTRGQQPLQALS